MVNNVLYFYPDPTSVSLGLVPPLAMGKGAARMSLAKPLRLGNGVHMPF